MPPFKKFAPYWTTDDGDKARVYLGNVLVVLGKLPAKSVQCCVTSPPYWGLRDYGTGEWEGGSEDCDHRRGPMLKYDPKSTLVGTTTTQNNSQQPWINGICGKCGAKRIDQQLGSEPSPDCGTQGQAQCRRCFVCNMVAVFRGVYRVLRDDGTLFLNLGDSYAGGVTAPGGSEKQRSNAEAQRTSRRREKIDIPSGNLVGIPWRVALALQADGWILRSDIPWPKRAAMPESVTNRPAKALEYVFMFVKKMGYFFDMEAIKPKSSSKPHKPGWTKVNTDRNDAQPDNEANHRDWGNESGRNFRNADLWFESVDAPHGLVGLDEELIGLDVTTEGYSGQHFATYPKGLIHPLILAGTSAKGACAKCGSPWRRVVVREDTRHWTERNEYARPGEGKYPLGDNPSGRNDGQAQFNSPKMKEVGWQPSCACHGTFEEREVEVARPVSLERAGVEVEGKYDRSLPRNRNGITGSLGSGVRETEVVTERVRVYLSSLAPGAHPVVPCAVLDPFLGSGTTGVVCLELGRRVVGVDLSQSYLDRYAIPRLRRLQHYQYGETRYARRVNNALKARLARKQSIRAVKGK